MKTMPWSQVVLAGPSVVLAAGLLAALALAAVGRSPIWPEQHLNVSEAIAAADDAELMRLMAGGADLNRSYDVRPPLMADDTVTATPIEAALRMRRADVLERLLSNGAAIVPSAWARLRCGADPAVAETLDRHRPPGASSDCPPR